MPSCLDKVLKILSDEYRYELQNVSDDTKEKIKSLCDSKPTPTHEEIALAIHLDYLLKQAKKKIADKKLSLTDGQLKEIKKKLAETHSVKSAIKEVFPGFDFDR